MSVSPQSLARTRDKRSLKVPARFDDFSSVVTVSRSAEKRTYQQSAAAESNGPTTNLDKDHQEVIKTWKCSSIHPTISIKRQSVKFSEATDASDTQPDATSNQDSQQQTAAPVIAAETVEATVAAAVTTQSPQQSTATTATHTTTQPLVEQRPNPNTNSDPLAFNSIINQPTLTPQNLAKQLSSKKKSKGFSLMVKPQGDQPQSQTISSLNSNNINHINTTLINTTPQRNQNNQQQSKYFNNLTPNMPQYGTRLLLNEPVYLPRTVNSIAPITTTLQQIANQARRPPFISKKAEAFIRYQDDRKLNYIASNHSALIKITRYLGIRDRLNLRCVNRTWRSIIDSELVWRKVLLTTGDENLNLTKLFSFLHKYNTTDLIFDGYETGKYWTRPNIGSIEPLIGDSLTEKIPKLRRIWFKTSTPQQNGFAYDFIRLLIESGCAENNNDKLNNTRTMILLVYWRVKVAVCELGIATIQLEGNKCDSEVAKGKGNFHFNDDASSTYSDEMTDDNTNSRSVINKTTRRYTIDLYDIEKELNSLNLDKRAPRYLVKLIIKPM